MAYFFSFFRACLYANTFLLELFVCADKHLQPTRCTDECDTKLVDESSIYNRSRWAEMLTDARQIIVIRRLGVVVGPQNDVQFIYYYEICTVLNATYTHICVC